MDPNDLFSLALQLSKEWRVVRSEFSGDPRRLELWLDFQPGTKFPDPESGELSPVHDTVERSWRHLSFWQYETILTARVPRIKAPDGSVRQVEAPWARAGSGFTLMFEAFAMLLCREMPVSSAAEILGEHDTRIWRVVKDYVLAAHAGDDWSSITRIAVDETSARRGHRYVTNVIDADNGKLLFMHPGRSAEALGEFKKALQAHGGDPQAIAVISMDMSPAYRKGAAEHFPDAKIVFDKFHVMLLAGKALDEVRKLLQREGADLKGSMWSLRGNEWNLRPEQLEERNRLCQQYKKLGRAFVLRETLQDIFGSASNSQEALTNLKWWCRRALLSRLEPFRELARTLKRHMEGVLAYFDTHITNGTIEAVNGLIQLAKRMARGFRSFTNFQAISYWKAGRLELNLPSL